MNDQNGGRRRNRRGDRGRGRLLEVLCGRWISGGCDTAPVRRRRKSLEDDEQVVGHAAGCGCRHPESCERLQAVVRADEMHHTEFFCHDFTKLIMPETERMPRRSLQTAKNERLSPVVGKACFKGCFLGEIFWTKKTKLLKCHYRIAEPQCVVTDFYRRVSVPDTESHNRRLSSLCFLI